MTGGADHTRALPGGSAVLVVLLGADRVDERKLADHLRLARRRVRLATTEEALRHSGYATGTVPPIGEQACVTRWSPYSQIRAEPGAEKRAVYGSWSGVDAVTGEPLTVTYVPFLYCLVHVPQATQGPSARWWTWA